MRRHYFLKFLSVALYYGWFGVMYGALFAVALQGYGFDGVWIKRVLVTVTLALTVWFAYRMEMRYHMPTEKYIVVALIAIFGMSGAATYPHFSWLFLDFFWLPSRIGVRIVLPLQGSNHEGDCQTLRSFI